MEFNRQLLQVFLLKPIMTKIVPAPVLSNTVLEVAGRRCSGCVHTALTERTCICFPGTICNYRSRGSNGLF